MKKKINELAKQNEELEGEKNRQASEIVRLRARVAQLEQELTKNQLQVPEPKTPSPDEVEEPKP